MGETTGISWTNHTFNPWWGCTKVSPGCDNCYAETFDKRVGGDHWGKGQPRRVMGDKYWAAPHNWNAKAKKAGVKELVFCASMADVMDDETPAGQRERLWELIDQTPNLIWQLLTKRPQRYQKYLPVLFRHQNVWLGATGENQETYNLRWPVLAAAGQIHGLLTFISYEPALGPLTLRPVKIRGELRWPDWVIFGGESGPGRRPMETTWCESILEQCAKNGHTAPFVKQFSAATPEAGKLLVPEFLRIHEFPKGGR